MIAFREQRLNGAGGNGWSVITLQQKEVFRQPGWNPIWFAIVLIVNLEAGLLTPPVGVNVFVVSAVAKLPTWQVFRAAMPFFFMMLVGLVILVAFPSITTWLPGVMFK